MARMHLQKPRTRSLCVRCSSGPITSTRKLESKQIRRWGYADLKDQFIGTQCRIACAYRLACQRSIPIKRGFPTIQHGTCGPRCTLRYTWLAPCACSPYREYLRAIKPRLRRRIRLVETSPVQSYLLNIMLAGHL